MKMAEVRKRAKVFGIKTGGRKKSDIIRDIQTAEGNTPCFGSSDGECDQWNCCWREDCLKAH